MRLNLCHASLQHSDQPGEQRGFRHCLCRVADPVLVIELPAGVTVQIAAGVTNMRRTVDGPQGKQWSGRDGDK